LLEPSSTDSSNHIDFATTSEDLVSEPCIKSELPEQSQLPLCPPSVLLKENSVYLEPGLKNEDDKLGPLNKTLPISPDITYPIKVVLNSSETSTKKRARAGNGGEESNETSREIGKRNRMLLSKQAWSDGAKTPLPPKILKSKKMSSKKAILEYWRHFEMEEMAKASTSGIEKKGKHHMEYPASNFEQLLSIQSEKGVEIQAKTVTVEEAHAIVSFVTAVAGPEALIQFKQALIGWRTQSMTAELMQANEFASVLKALNHLETQNAFNSIATRIKLVQLAESVDVGHLALPSPKGRGNPIVKWLSTQYKLFLHAEFPDLKEGSTAWNTKLDDIKRKVKAGRRWQQLIKQFGVGIVGLVPSFTQSDGRNSDFNRRYGIIYHVPGPPVR
jgi:hypothetical protein